MSRRRWEVHAHAEGWGVAAVFVCGLVIGLIFGARLA